MLENDDESFEEKRTLLLSLGDQLVSNLIGVLQKVVYSVSASIALSSVLCVHCSLCLRT